MCVYVCVSTSTQCGSLQQLALDSLPSSFPSYWHLDIQNPEAATLLQLLVQTSMHACTHTHIHARTQDWPLPGMIGTQNILLLLPDSEWN